MKNLTIQSKLILGFSVSIVVLLIVAFYGTSRLFSLNDTLNRTIDYSAKKRFFSVSIEANIAKTNRAQINAILETDPELLQKYLGRREKYTESTKEFLTNIRPILIEEGKRSVDEIKIYFV